MACVLAGWLLPSRTFQIEPIHTPIRRQLSSPLAARKRSTQASFISICHPVSTAELHPYQHPNLFFLVWYVACMMDLVVHVRTNLDPPTLPPAPFRQSKTDEVSIDRLTRPGSHLWCSLCRLVSCRYGFKLEIAKRTNTEDQGQNMIFSSLRTWSTAQCRLKRG